MKTEKTINLTAYTVEYIDQREPKPRTVHTQTVVLDGRQDQRPGPAGTCARRAGSPSSLSGTATPVASVHKGETIAAHVDLADLWQQTAAQIEHDRLKAQLQAALAQLNSEETEVEA